MSFYGRTINNHTAFIRIKTNSSMEDSPIALPVEVKVTQGKKCCTINLHKIYQYFCILSATGIFLSREFIDFGLLKSGGEYHLLHLWDCLTSVSQTDDIKPVPLFLLNAGPGSVHVSVSII